MASRHDFLPDHFGNFHQIFSSGSLVVISSNLELIKYFDGIKSVLSVLQKSSREEDEQSDEDVKEESPRY